MWHVYRSSVKYGVSAKIVAKVASAISGGGSNHQSISWHQSNGGIWRIVTA